MAPICEIILALDPRLAFEKEPLKEILINRAVGYEYGTNIILCLSTPRRNLDSDRHKLKQRQEKDVTIQRAKEELDAYEAAWPTQVSQTHIFECLNAY